MHVIQCDTDILSGPVELDKLDVHEQTIVLLTVRDHVLQQELYNLLSSRQTIKVIFRCKVDDTVSGESEQVPYALAIVQSNHKARHAGPVDDCDIFFVDKVESSDRINVITAIEKLLRDSGNSQANVTLPVELTQLCPDVPEAVGLKITQSDGVADDDTAETSDGRRTYRYAI